MGPAPLVPLLVKPAVAPANVVVPAHKPAETGKTWNRADLWSVCLACISQCAPTGQITSGGRTHPRRLLVELGSLRASEPGNRLGRSLAIKPTKGG